MNEKGIEVNKKKVMVNILLISYYVLTTMGFFFFCNFKNVTSKNQQV